MTEDCQQATIKRNLVLARIAFGNLIDYKNYRNNKYLRQINAVTFYNVNLKQKSFVELKHYAISKIGKQEKFY